MKVNSKVLVGIILTICSLQIMPTVFAETENQVTLLTLQKLQSTNTVSLYILSISPSVPINALYIHVTHTDSCGVVNNEQNSFPLLLESTSTENSFVFAAARLGSGVYTSTDVLRFSCLHTNQKSLPMFTLEKDSRTYTADGFGTENLIDRFIVK